MTVTQTLSLHIEDKISYHEKLRIQFEASEQFEQCARHRDEVTKLKKMLA